jgi:hypothetical protein
MGQGALAHKPVDGPAAQADPVPSIALHRMQRFMRVLEQAMAQDDVAERLSKAGVSVRISLKDLPQTSVMLLLDRSPARLEAGTGEGRPDVWLSMWSADLEAVLSRSDFLPLQILSGDVQFQGFVRKLLRVLPILTAAAAKVGADQSA